MDFLLGMLIFNNGLLMLRLGGGVVVCGCGDIEFRLLLVIIEGVVNELLFFWVDLGVIFFLLYFVVVIRLDMFCVLFEGRKNVFILSIKIFFMFI